MGCKELIESLRRAADDKALTIWDEVEAEAASVRAEAARRLGPVREEFERRKSGAVAGAMARALSEAQNAARRSRLGSEREVAERVFTHAREALVRLRGPGYPDLFSALVRELPHLPWKTVRVNPADAALAREQFPGAVVEPDDAVAGGMAVSTDGGAMRVDNTFEKRLERVWTELLPRLMQEVYGELSKHSAA